MAEKGIIIDVGFAPQWKDFLNEIDKELSKINFDKYINLDDAFDKQAKEIRQKLKDLKKEINSIMNGNNSDPVKAFNELNKSVKSLSGVVLNMAKAMPDGTEYTREINSITNSIEELSDQAQNAVNTVESLSEVSVEKLNFKPQLDQLKELWGELDKVYKALDNPRAKNKSNGIPYSEEDSEELISKIRAEYNVYLEISEQIGNIQYDTTLSAEEMDEKLNRAYISIGKTISKLNNLVLSSEKIGIDSSLEIDTGINIDSVKLDIDEQTNEIVDYINTAKARIQNEFTQLGGNEDLESWFTKRGKASGGIKIPISLDSNSRKKLYNQTIDVIHKVQSELNEPILVEVQLVSAYQSRGNQTILSQIQEELNNIKDGEITQNLQSLIDKMNKRVENAFMLNIHLNTQNATNQLRHFIKNIKDEIRDVQRLLTINPEFEITPEIRQKLIDEIEEVKSLYKLTIDVGFDFDSEELQNEIVKLDSLYEKIDELKNTNILELDETNSKNIESQITVIQKAIEKLIQTGNQGDKTISLLKTLQSSLKELSSNKSINQINKFSDALNNLKKSFQNLNRVKDVALLSSIQEILNKGEELKTFAEILKSTKKEIQNAEKALSKQDKLLEGNLNLENYSDIIKQRALNNIPDIDFKLMSQSLEATSEGLVKVTSLIKTADGEYVKYIHTATDGEEIQQQKIESGTASILKQAKAIERLNAKAEENKELKKIGEVAPGTEKWEELIVLIESFGIKLKDVKQIIQTIDEEGYESFQVYHGDGLRTTLGMNSKDILYAKNNIADLTDTTDKFQSILKKLPSEFKKAFKDNGLSTGVFIDDIQELLELYQKLYSLSASGMNIDFGNVQEQVNDLRTSITNVFKYDPSLVTEGFESQFNSIRDDFLKLFNNITQGTSMSESEIKKLVASLAEVGKQFEDLKDKSNVLTNKKSIANALKTVQTELFQNSAMDKQFKKVLTSYRDELQNALDLYNKGMEKEAGLTKERLSEIVSGIMEIQGKIQASEKTGLSTINKIGKAIKTNFVQYVARYLSIQDIIRYLSSMTREVKNIDTALTELRKVSDATTERLQVSLKKSAETAKELGNSIDYVINITSDWARLGFNVDEAEELARVTTLFKNVGDNMSAEDASSFMISTLQGFQMTAEESESIVDKFNEVANNYAIDTAGIGEALQRSAASFNAANTSLSGAIAVITTANSVVQNPEQVGTAMKTLSARIRGSKAELEELGEEEENVVNLTSKLRAEVKAMTGFDIMADEETYKSIDEIIIGIGEHWQELTDIQQAALAEDLAGKRNSNVLIALLQNAEQVKKVYDTAEGSAGSAMREQENYAKSIEYSIYRVKAIWQDLITKVLKSENIKKLVDTAGDSLEKIGNSLENFVPLLTLIMNLLSGVIDLLGKAAKIGNGIPLLAGIGVAGYKLKNIDSGKDDIFKLLKNKISAELIKSKEKEIAVTTASTIANKAETESELKKVAAKKADIVVSTEDAVATGAQATATTAETAANNKNTTSLIKNTAETIKNTAAKVANLVATHPIITGVTVAVVAAVAVWYRYSKSIDYAIKKHKKLLESQKEEAEVIQKNIDSTKEKINSLEELTKQYESAVEGSSEYYELANKIAELDPSLTIGYTSNGDAILADTEKIRDQIEALKELREEQLQQKKDNSKNIIDTSSTLLNDYNEKKKSFEDEIKELEAKRDDAQKDVDRLINVDGLNDEDMVLQSAKNAVGMYQGMIDNIKNGTEYKEVINNIKEQQKELIENFVYLFDEIPDSLSTAEKEYEKSIRQFALDIAKSSEKALSSDEFLSLYNGLENRLNRDALTKLFELNDKNLPVSEYQKEAQDIYDLLIKSLDESGFELDDNNKLALSVALKIDEKSKKDFINDQNRFAQSLGVTGVQSREAQYWYSKLSVDDIKLVEKHIDEISNSVKFISADNFVSGLDKALEDLKGINEEVETLKDFTLKDLSENVTSKLSSIESLYNTFNSDIVNGEKTRLDIDDVEGLRSSLVASDENPLGVTTEQFEEFERVVADGTHSVEEMQDAFDKLSTEFVDATLSLNGYTSKNKELIKAQLEEAGYTKESVDAYVEYKTALHEVDEAVQNNLIHINGNVKAMLSEAEAAGIDKSALIEYYTTKLTADMLSMSTVEDVIQLANELEALGINCDKLREYIALKQTAGSIEATTGFNGTTKNTAAMIAQQKGQANVNPNGVVQDLQKQLLDNINLVNKTTKEAAGGGGSEAGDAYVEAFEKELQELDDLKEAGIISEREYLERLRDLNQRYFKDKAQYAKEYAKYEKQYLQGMSDLYNKAIGGAISVLNFQKNKLEKERDKAVKALEKERDAAIKPVQDQIDALEDEQKALEKERDAMQKANDERERAINLQKAQYELERANAQRTRLIYKNGQMQYVNDYQEVRDAKKNLEDALFDEKMAKMDEQIDNINEQIEGLNDQLDEINKHYDDLIKSTEEFYDEQIEQLQDMIDMWEEFQAQMELSEALAALDEFGITMDDILSGNPEAFAKLTQGYAACQATLTGNIAEIAQALGVSEEEIRGWIEQIGADFSDAFSDTNVDTSGIDKLSNAISGGGGGGTSTGTGTGGGGGTAGGGLTGDVQNLSNGIKDLNTNLGTINSVPMENLANSIERIVDVLGEEGFAGIFKMPENFNLANMVQQFSDMADKISGITTAITGGGGQSKGTTDWSDNTDYHSEGGESGEEGDTLLSALSQIGEKQADIQALSDTFAPEDGSLSSNVETAGKAISDGDSEDSLTGKFIKLKEGAEENVSPVVEMFAMLLMQITMCVTAVEQLTTKMTTLRDVNINGVESSGNFSGTAYANGNWSAKSKGSSGVALTGELGEELVVDSKTGRWHTVGTNGAEFAKINPNDIVFNHKQTEALFKNGKINSRGKTYASGNNNRFTSLTPEELSKYNKLDFTKDLAEKLDFGNQKLMNIDKTVSTISNNKTVNNNPVINVNNPTFTCTGVTGEEVLAQIEQSFTGLFTNAYQQSMMR